MKEEILNNDIKDMYSEWNEDLASLSLLRNEMKDDDDCYVGNQWTKIKKKQGKPYLSINLVKKRIDWVSGFHRQNRNGMKTLPHEGSDDFRSDVYNQILQLMFSSRPIAYQLDTAVDDCIRMGIGWFFVCMEYEKDFLNGDIKIYREDPFKVLFDPYMNNPDLSDCSHIFRRAYMSKDHASALYPDFAKQIKDAKLEDESKLENTTARQYGSQSNRINILEKWYRETVTKPVAVNLTTMETITLEKGKENDFLMMVQTPEEWKIVNRKMGIIKMKRSIGDDIIAYDGPSPYLEDEYPLIPLFWTFNPSNPDWHWKVQGLVRPMRDLQLEKNKRRSQLMEFILSKNMKGYKVRKGSGIDMTKFLTGDEQVVEVENLDDIDQFDPPKIPEAYMMMEKENDNDFNMVSIPADMLGVAETVQDMPVGIAQLRQRANYTQIQHGLDNIWLAYEILSKQIIKLVNKHWDVKKIQRIVGENVPYQKELKELEKQAIEIQKQQPQSPEEQMQFVQQGEEIMGQLGNIQQKVDDYWKDFDDGRDDIEWDVRFGDLQDTPSYKLATLATLSDYIHQGHQVPDSVIREYMELSPKVKEMWAEEERKSSEAQQQQAQQAMQFEMSKEQMKAQVKMAVQELVNEGQIEVANIRAQDVYESNVKIERGPVTTGDNKY